MPPQRHSEKRSNKMARVTGILQRLHPTQSFRGSLKGHPEDSHFEEKAIRHAYFTIMWQRPHPTQSFRGKGYKAFLLYHYVTKAIPTQSFRGKGYMACLLYHYVAKATPNTVISRKRLYGMLTLPLCGKGYPQHSHFEEKAIRHAYFTIMWQRPPPTQSFRGRGHKVSLNYNPVA